MHVFEKSRHPYFHPLASKSCPRAIISSPHLEDLARNGDSVGWETVTEIPFASHDCLYRG